MSKKHKERRIKFARDTILKDSTFLIQLVCSDKKKFNLNGPDGYTHYWHDKRIKEVALADNTPSIIIMVWACITNIGKKKIVFVDGNINAQKYIKILEENLLEIMDDGDLFFQQDNARPHTAKATKEWFIANEISVIDWPAYSPDLNIIENVWGILTERIYKGRDKFSNLGELKSQILSEWQKLSIDDISNLYKSLPKKLLNVIEKKGCFLV